MMRPLTFAIPLLALALAGCGTPSEADLMERAEDSPAGPAALTPMEDPTLMNDEAGRQAFQAAMRDACPATPVSGAECRATDDPTRFACQYNLADGERGEMHEATIARQGNAWVLVETPAHCGTADSLEADQAG